ncbi:MAG: cobalt ECF transporter T component CbiQ [Roseiarcus sp.]
MGALTQDKIPSGVAHVHADEGGDILRAHGIGDDQNVALHRVDPRLRVITCFGFALLVVSMSRPMALIAALAVAVAAIAAARVELRPAWRAMAALDGSMILVIALLPFTMPGEPLVSVFGYPASSEGLWRAAQITLKSNAVVLMTLALLGSTELVDIGHALEKLRVPAKLVQLLLMTVRYIDVLGREYRRLRVAMTVRGFQMRCNVHTWRAMGYLFGMLFVRSLERAERISAAMRCRGFTGRFPTLSDMALARRDAVFAVIAVLAALAVGSLELA